MSVFAVAFTCTRIAILLLHTSCTPRFFCTCWRGDGLCILFVFLIAISAVLNYHDAHGRTLINLGAVVLQGQPMGMEY